MNLYDVSVPQMIRVLGQAHRWLDKAQAYAEQKKFDPEVLLSARLAPDQWHLGMQIHVLGVAPLRLGALLRGEEPPRPELVESTIPALRSHLDAALAELRAVSREAVNGLTDRVIALPFMQGKGMTGADFVVQFALPNFYFHAVTAYSILRHSGVDVGKMDFLGELTIRDL